MADRIGPEGPKGPSGPQGKRGARGATSDPSQGERGPRGLTGKDGSRTKLPRRVFVAFLILVAMSSAGIAIAVRSYQAIQANRFQVIVEGCVDTNSRSLNALAALGGFPQAASNLTARQKANLAATKLLIQAALPYRGNPTLSGAARQRSEQAACEAYATDRLGGAERR